MKIDLILNYLECPNCHNARLLAKDSKQLVCGDCHSFYPITRGVPILLKANRLGEQERKQRKWFNQHYSHFSHQKYQLENWRLSMLERVFRIDFADKVKTYLDIGTGATGYTVIEAAKRKKWLSFGVDISLEAMLKAKSLAQKQGVRDKVIFLVCSAENLPFKPETFDYITALGVLEHLEKDEKAIRNVAKILKKGGYFYICTPNAYRRIWPFLWPIYFYLDKKIGHKRHYSLEGLSQKMKKEGFKLERVFYNGHLIKLVQLILGQLHLIGEKTWWRWEKKDINQNSIALQLNAIYRKEKG